MLSRVPTEADPSSAELAEARPSSSLAEPELGRARARAQPSLAELELELGRAPGDPTRRGRLASGLTGSGALCAKIARLISGSADGKGLKKSFGEASLRPRGLLFFVLSVRALPVRTLPSKFAFMKASRHAELGRGRPASWR